MNKKEQATRNVNVLTPSGLSGKTVTGISIWRAGIIDVIEINYTGGPTFIKIRAGEYEVGGTADWGTGKAQ